MTTGRIWWVFDTEQELEEWARGKDVAIITINDTMDPPRLNVTFEVDRDRAMQILGAPVGEEEWLEPYEDEPMKPFERACHDLIETIKGEGLDLPNTIEHLKTLAELSRLGGLSSKGELLARMSFNTQRDSVAEAQ